MQMVRRVDLDRIQLNRAKHIAVIGETGLCGQVGQIAQPVTALLVRIRHPADFQQSRILTVEIEMLVNLAHHRTGADDSETKTWFHFVAANSTVPVCCNRKSARNSAALRISSIAICSWSEWACASWPGPNVSTGMPGYSPAKRRASQETVQPSRGASCCRPQARAADKALRAVGESGSPSKAALWSLSKVTFTTWPPFSKRPIRRR